MAQKDFIYNFVKNKGMVSIGKIISECRQYGWNPDEGSIMFRIKEKNSELENNQLFMLHTKGETYVAAGKMKDNYRLFI